MKLDVSDHMKAALHSLEAMNNDLDTLVAKGVDPAQVDLIRALNETVLTQLAIMLEKRKSAPSIMSGFTLAFAHAAANLTTNMAHKTGEDGSIVTAVFLQRLMIRTNEIQDGIAMVFDPNGKKS
jgi:hypothetical protein